MKNRIAQVLPAQPGLTAPAEARAPHSASEPRRQRHSPRVGRPALGTTCLLLLCLSARAATFTNDTVIPPADSSYDGQSIVVDGCTLTLDGPHAFGSVRVLAGGTLTHSAGAVSGGLNLTVAGHFEVAPGGTIRTAARGHPGASGPGAGGSAGSPASGGGGGHAGQGGLSSSNAPGGLAYGASDQPDMFGSGGGVGVGGPGGAGGGAIHLSIGGVAVFDGLISADGANGVASRSGGGAGGSIWIQALRLTGSGMISANGGAGEPSHGGGGGGGRIALHFGTNDFTGLLRARGGAGWQPGGAGTVFTRQLDAPLGDLLVDNAQAAGAITPLEDAPVESLLVQGGAVLGPATNLSLATLTVRSNAWLALPPGRMQLDLTVSGDALLAAGGGINVSGQGFPSSQGLGMGRFYAAGANSSGGGGGHAGWGGTGSMTNASAGGAPNGIVAQPVTPGSGGGGDTNYPGGAGGGAVRLSVLGRLQLDGDLLADGTPPASTLAGGGAGGSVWLTAGELAGHGRISARGGAAWAPNGGGGSGGRIAVYFDTNTFSGTLAAHGGAGRQNGASGTVLTRTNSAAYAQVLVDNGGLPGTNTSASGVNTVDLTIAGGARADSPGTVNQLVIRTNGALALSGPTATLSVLRDARIESGGLLTMDGVGYPAGSGPGAGKGICTGSPAVCSAGGGAHGGNGGNGSQGPPNAAGGFGYDVAATPSQAGSGGGLNGGAGGGALRVIVNGLLQLDGRISADGLPGSNRGSGGGAGGSIWLELNRLAGQGALSANGGSGDLPLGGGGGGGRIAVTFNSGEFGGTCTARGGMGYVVGGAGTVYLATNRPASALLIVDNGGWRGAASVIAQPYGVALDLILRSGGYVTNAGDYPPSFFCRNLLIGSGSWIFLAAQGLTASNNVTIEAGGGITADGRGATAGSGQGAGRYSSAGAGGGGGNGGYGGSGALGGSSSGGGVAIAPFSNWITEAWQQGAGGGNSSPGTATESAGGGKISFSVGGQLRLDGSISAKGNPGFTMGAGGGAGGGIYLVVGALSGSGSINADGGAGDWPNGGGGGGGRVAIRYATNNFTGVISARGGDGFMAGGAGTIFLNHTQGTPVLLADNGGQNGSNTLITPYTPGSDVIVQGGAKLVSTGQIRATNLVVHPNSTVLLSNSLFVARDAVIHAGGSVQADGLGFGPGLGTGAGSHALTPKGGGSHGGLGGANPVAAVYGSLLMPTNWGSGGASASGQSGVDPQGGAGGGVARVEVAGRLTVNGHVSADGLPGGPNSGGGAGGSVWITADTLAGTGLISANGGAGSGPAGGGGGGRVAVGFRERSFTGDLAAHGGAGAAPGGAGTVYTVAGGQARRLALDNGGLAGPGTPLSGLPEALDLAVSGGAVVFPQTDFPPLKSLEIGPGGRLTPAADSPGLEVVTEGDLVIAAGGALTADGLGHVANTGQGAGVVLASQGSGGGHGGAGGASASGAPGGLPNGEAAQPTSRGSGGGAEGGALTGSAGGGALRVSVGGTLTVDGRLTADGEPGWLDDAGGGAGGSVWITAGAVTGGGTITACGGDGEWFNGGGGGGGRIALYTAADTHTGPVSVLGGLGAEPGQPGTVVRGLSPHFEVAMQPLAGGDLRLAWRGCEGLRYQVETSTNLIHWTAFGPLQPGTNGWMNAALPREAVPANFCRVRSLP